MSTDSNPHGGPVVNSSAIADMSSWVENPKTSPLANLFRKMHSPDADAGPEKYARRIVGSQSNESCSSGDSKHNNIYDIVKYYLETHRGEQGSDDQRAKLATLVQELVTTKDGFDIAALAFLATINGKVLEESTRIQINELIRQRMNDSGFHEDTPRLDDIYTKFMSDAYHYRALPRREAISVLDTHRFAYKWLHHGTQSGMATAFHWEIRHLNSAAVDSMSVPFEINKSKCVIRFRRSYMLSNGETWTGVWLHNVGHGRKVLDLKFALVLSNIAYPTVYQVEVIKPSKGIRPSQGVGVKLFAPVDKLIRCSNGNDHPIAEHNSIRVSVIAI
ncbi:hypothetical protein H4R23_001446 [Coemansia sp. Cherry 401B]|nr:hypothetical protein H4R23_001446 [Coemansia sp. Cherry 401B]